MREQLRTTLILRLPAAVHVANPALPVSARLCGSAPQYRAGRRPAGRCRRRNTAPSLRSPWPPPLRTQLPRRASRRAALRASARDIRRPAARAFSGWGGVFARPLACLALRAKSPRPRLASLAPRRVRLRLTPSPRSRRRANLPLLSPTLRAQRRSDSATILPLLPPCPFRVARRAPPASNGSRCSRQ
jgi:hypothetical protein